MGKRKKKPAQRRKGVSLAPLPERVANRITRGDTGPDTPMQRLGKVTEDVTWVDDKGKLQKSPNNMKRARRIDLVEMYERKGVLDHRQVKAGKLLRVAWENTGKSPAAIKAVQVDSTPKPDHAIAMQIDRMSQFIALMRHVKPQYREIVDCVILNNCIPAWLPKYRGPKYPLGIAQMQEALADLADSLDL